HALAAKDTLIAFQQLHVIHVARTKVDVRAPAAVEKGVEIRDPAPAEILFVKRLDDVDLAANDNEDLRLAEHFAQPIGVAPCLLRACAPFADEVLDRKHAQLVLRNIAHIGSDQLPRVAGRKLNVTSKTKLILQ